MSKPAFDALARQISSCNPHDAQAQTALVNALNALRDACEVVPGSKPFRCLDAASLLTELLGRLQDDRAATQVKNVVAALLRAADGPSGADGKSSNGARNRVPVEMDPGPEGPQSVELTTPDGVRRIKPSNESPPKRLRLINEMLLGEILYQLGLVTAKDIERAVEQQSITGKPLGITLVELGAASAEDIETGLRFQHQLQAPRASASNVEKRARGIDASVVSDLLLGETLVRLGMIDSEQLKQGLLAHHAAGVRIGEALAEAGYVTWEQIAKAVEIQRQYRGR